MLPPGHSHAAFILQQLLSDHYESIAHAIPVNPYSKARRTPIKAEQRLYLKEVSFVCPLCGKSFDTENNTGQINFIKLPIFFRIAPLRNNINF